MSNKNLVLRKDTNGKKFFNYKSGTFYRVDMETGLQKSNQINLILKIDPDLINELRHWVKMGHKVIEIRQREIWLKDLHEKEVYEKTVDIEVDFEDEDHEHYNNEVIKAEKYKELKHYIRNNHFIYTSYDLFKHNLDDVSLRYDHEKRVLEIQNVKVFKNGKVNTYTHKVNGVVFKQLRKMLTKK